MNTNFSVLMRLARTCLVGSVLGSQALISAAVGLVNQPVFAVSEVPGNLVLALSVEFPTAVTAADRGTFTKTKKYVGYFDPLRCYSYQYNDATLDRNGVAYGSYFYPVGAALTTTGDSCAGNWSGNFMNWATMQAVDPFRWALTGGYRAVDDVNVTILEKAFAPSNQGGTSNNFPHKSINSEVNKWTPFSTGNFNMRVLRCGTRMIFNRTSTFSAEDCPTTGVTVWDGNVATTNVATNYSVDVRVKVCASAAIKEVNCVQYGGNYKPEGLIQKYADKIRYSAFGYLNDPKPTGGSTGRDGGVMRARMKFVGPMQPVPGSIATSNTLAEWSATTGQFERNPDPIDATASSETGSLVSNSGVMNYLNQFGRSSQAYKYYDPVSELYYAATRYLRNKGDVAAFSDLSKFDGGSSTLATRTAMKDGFPVIRSWEDPIKYSCQKNFVLGIGDTNSNQDKTVPGAAAYRSNEPATIPTEVTNDTIDVVAATNKVGVMEGDMSGTIGKTDQYNTSANSAYIAGMAYMFNTTDIRSDLTGEQTITTYWLDVLEGSDYKSGSSGRNQFYLAAKYGGFTVPAGYSYLTQTAKLPQNLWATTTDALPVSMNGLTARPDNFYVADQAEKMVVGLTNAFASIARRLKNYTTSFSLSTPQITSTTAASYASQYDSANWTGVLTASSIAFAADGTPTSTPVWNTSVTLEAQLAGTTGADTKRRVVTWNGTGVGFQAANLSTAQQAALATSYTSADDVDTYVKYLRGARTNERTATDNSKMYRARAFTLGDVVNAKVTAVGPPSMSFSDAVNPGYATFKSNKSTRPTMAYVGANDGMLHAFNGSLTDANKGQEQFAYVPSALFAGPTGSPATDGLAQLGNPDYDHRYYVDATPLNFDIDFNNSGGAFTTTSAATSNWKTLLIGGLGKGGKSYYALDVTDPGAITTEAIAATKVKWEFTDSTMGYSFGAPNVIKTKKYGWVVVLTSGYNNSGGKGHIYLVNPATGIRLETITTPTASNGLTETTAYVKDFTDGTADAIYAGDLDGQLWRFDLTLPKGSADFYPAPAKIATLSDEGGNAQPITTAPLVEIQAVTKKRYIMVGTGQLLDTTDLKSGAAQSFYAILDGDVNSFGIPGTTYPISRASLKPVTDLTAGVGLTAADLGWYVELGADGGVGWRVNASPTSFNGIVAFSSLLTTGDVCSPGGKSRLYAIDFGSGKSALTGTDGNTLIPYTSFESTLTDFKFISVGGKVRLLTGDVKGVLSNIGVKPPGSVSVRLLNWREIPTID